MKDKVSFTLDRDVMAAVRKFATEDERPISISNAIDMLLREAMLARGVYVTPGNIVDVITANPPFEAPKPPRKGKARPAE